MTDGLDESVQVICKANNQESIGVLYFKSFSSSIRFKRAIKGAGATLMATIVAILIPVAHFVLVPVGIIAIPVIFYWKWKTSSVVTKSQVTCPACGAELHINSQSELWPKVENCPRCCRAVEIIKA